jgi:hypothetical protein
MIEVVSSTVLNITAVAVSFCAVVFSLFFAAQQIRVMRQTNQMPIFIDMIREFRSKEFQQAEHYVLHRLKYENSPDSGILKLQDEARIAATTVHSFFGVLADLVMRDIISEEAAVSTLGFRASNLWDALEPFIVAERKLRGDNDFACYYEDLVSRVRPHWPPEKYYGRTRRRLDGINADRNVNQTIPSRSSQASWMAMSAEERAAHVITEILHSGATAKTNPDVMLRKLGIRVRCGDVRQAGLVRGNSRYLGPLVGACAGVICSRKPTTSATLSSRIREKMPSTRTVFVAFANGRRHEHHLYWVSRTQIEKVNSQVSSFNTMVDGAD